MIYFVNDNPGYDESDPYVLECQLSGHEARRFTNADEALEHLSKAQDVELILVSSVIAMNVEPSESAFTLSETNNGTTIGSALIHKLGEARPDLVPGKTVLFDHEVHSIRKAVVSINTLKNQGIPFVPLPDKGTIELFTPGEPSYIGGFLEGQSATPVPAP